MVRDECYDNVRPGQEVDDGNFFSREKNVHHMYENQLEKLEAARGA